MNGKILKYLIYVLALPAIGFACMFMLRRVTAGAHDGGFLGMMFGLTVGQIIFSSWLTNLRWYFRILFGLLLAVVTISISFWIIGTIRDIYNPIKAGGFFRDPDEQLEDRLTWIFFIALGLISVILIVGVNKLTAEKSEK
jgi:hypothetical protein